MANPKIVVLGGGTGSHELLLGLKDLTTNLTAVVNMCDDGGSTGRLRRDYDVPPPGDIRQCLVALSDAPDAAAMFSYRFREGDFVGHPVGNIILTALTRQHSDFQAAIDIAEGMLKTRGRVLPVTTELHQLVMNDGGNIITGQEAIRLHTIRSPKDLSLLTAPAVKLNQTAAVAIEEADMVIIAPGGFYWSIMPMFAVEGLASALASTKAHIVFVVNLMNHPEQHPNWSAIDYVRSLELVLGKGVIDAVIYNTEKISEELMSAYAADGETPVFLGAGRLSGRVPNLVGAELVTTEVKHQNAADNIWRTLIRHDSKKTATVIQGLLEKLK